MTPTSSAAAPWRREWLPSRRGLHDGSFYLNRYCQYGQCMRADVIFIMQKYEIIDVIDEGAYGIVWKALNKESGGLVAIKEFKQSDEDEFSRKTIQREIKMLKMLKGDYVVGIKEAFKKKGKIYLIFEYFDRNLLNLIEKYEHGLDPRLIANLLYKIIKCLQYLHSKNIIHRDVKPENILLSADHSVLKICDFGFARFLPESDYDMTEYVATRWYRSPELLVGEPYGKAADMWAVGCMIGELVDGQPMFPGDDEIDQLYIIQKSVGDLTRRQKEFFKNNPKFSEIQLPDVKRTESIETRYLGKIEKNALSFMRSCLKMDASERLTVEDALKHPYLISFSIQDNEFSNDEQNLLSTTRKPFPILKNESKASLLDLKEEEDRMAPLKTKFFSNKQGLKHEGGSMGERLIQYITPSDELEAAPSSFLKKKSHTNLNVLQKEESPEKKGKKLSKMMSEEKNLKVNLDVNVKINLKINQKGERRDLIRDQIESKLNLHNNPSKSKLLPEIKNNSKGMRYQLNIRHQKPNQLISVIGESKELIRGSKPALHH